MGKEYYRCLKEIGLEVHVIGRSNKSFTKFNNIKNISKYTSFKDFTNSENSKDFDIAIVSVSVEALYQNTMSLLETGIKKILIEKPGSLSLEQLLELVQQGKFAESEEATEREQKFAREKNRQATLLANAKAERSRLEAMASELEGRFEANDA